MRSDYDRGRYSNGSSIKRGGGRRDDDGNAKRGRFEGASDSFDPQFNRSDEGPVRAMLTFKKFLETQDESISDEEAIHKYNDYKIEYQKQECEKFFAAHKEEEWFQMKYHPEISKEWTEANRENLEKRLKLHNELVVKTELFGDLRLDYDNCANIIRFMDVIALKLEGGTDDDINILMNAPVFDESVDELQKKRTSGNSENGKANESASFLGLNGNVKVEEEPEDVKELIKRVPFRTQSIFFRNIPPTVKFEEIENECKNFPGYLRIGVSEPVNDQKFVRRVWVSFRRDVKIKDIFWNLKNAKFTDADVQASVNRDLRRKVRNINGIASHRPVVQSDIRHAARLVALFDYKRRLFRDENDEVPKDLDALVGSSKNPLLEDVLEHFVEECNAEEEELLGVSTSQGGDVIKFPLEVDRNLIAYLDKLLIYLRVVHSIDFYNHCEYPNEDRMPNRMGMFHVRDAPPGDLVPKENIDSYISNTEDRLKSNVLKYNFISAEDLTMLGKKDPDVVLENFITANCVEVAKDKWLCPLSGKKFKGPEFIRKHLFSKHEQKLDETKAEAIYFNNYLADPERPHNPEPKVSASSSGDDDKRRGNDERFSSGHRGWADRPRFSAGGRLSTGGNMRSEFNRNRWSEDFGTGRRDPRQPPSYRDLDAPEEII